MADSTAIRYALQRLSAVGVTALDQRPGTNATPIWAVTIGGRVTTYCCSLENLLAVLAL
jgi:hypothetical protein